MPDISNLISNYKKVRQKTINIANMFDQEDQLDQSMKDASPIIWHLGHTSWFFDNFILKVYDKDYKKVAEKYYFFFNSYYQLAGKMLSRNQRGSDITLSLNKVGEKCTSIKMKDSSTNIDYILADPNVIPKVPVLKELPKFVISVKLDNNFINQFIKSNNLITTFS